MFSENVDISVKDPVCGKALAMTDVIASEMHDGWAFYFCSSRCRDQFANSPARYKHNPS